MASKTKLSAREEEILNLLRQGIMENGYPPTVREICAMTGLKSTATVHGYLERLEKKGYIKKAEDKPRAITIINHEDYYADAVEAVLVPLVGEVAAGSPILATENIETSYPLPKEMVKESDCFLLRIRGESMIEAGILPGDLVLVRRQNAADNGDIVVALIEDEATVKRFFKEKNQVRLQPENSIMEPIFTKDVNILGKVIGLLRTIS
ncbi:MAG TPA: transcriptional repressor LexA [Firmicutes bacterium]|nr:transcriptional repressor LexA [Bacillota bacterium]